jgi:formylglycine-generating enzyme required for sulfatase activity
VGWNKSTVTASFWDTQTSGRSGSAGGTPKTTAEMKIMSTFTDVAWDFVNVWHLCEGTNYPRLLWQIPAGDFLCPYGVDVLDLAFFVDRWLDGDCNESNDFCNCTDINHDAQVDFGDFAFFSRHWLESGENDTDGQMPTILGRGDIGANELNPFAVEFVVVNKRRVDRSVFEYECEVILENISASTFENVQLVMVSYPDNMTMIDPHVTFGDARIRPGESIASIDTCSFTVDRSEPINPMYVLWRYVAAPEDMVFIPGGTFEMGDSFAEGDADELPVHTVTVDSFYMGKYEVTNRQYCDYLNSALGQGLITVTSGVVYKPGSGTSYGYSDTSTNSSFSQIAYGGGVFTVRTKNGRDMANDPMVCVSWYGAAACCNWRSQQEGKEQCYNLSTWACDFGKHGYRLATEAEWEYGARGGLSGRRFPWGDTISHSRANYYSSSTSYDLSPTRGYHPTWDDVYPYTSPGGSFAANGLGLYDMSGNVWEWCNDWYSSSYYSSSPTNNPTGPGSGSFRVFRGGSWYSHADYCRVAYRYDDNPADRHYSVGFRLVLDF